MHLPTLSKQVIPLLAYLILLPSFQLVSASDASSLSGPSADPENPFISCFDSDEPASDESASYESASDDGPTDDKSPGIGVELETSYITFLNSQCSSANTNQAKGQLVDSRQGQYWKLTADTTGDVAGLLTAEYILDGTQLKIGAGTVGPAAGAVASDLTAWNPKSGDQVNVAGNQCNPWRVANALSTLPNSVSFARQITAPMPLEAINDLIQKAKIGQSHPLLPAGTSSSSRSRLVWVQSGFFQSNPYGLTPNDVKADALGFFSLVLSYAKSASLISSGVSLKTLTSIMPRTDFVTMYNDISPEIQSGINSGSLFDIVNILACYQSTATADIELDGNFCTGTLAAPTPNNQMVTSQFLMESGGQEQTVTVKDWMDNLQTGQDLLSQADKIIDGQIGAFGTAVEYVLGTTREVPLFEFRDLGASTAPNFQNDITAAENAIIAYHQQFATPPSKHRRMRRDSEGSLPKRQINSTLSACPAVNNTSTGSDFHTSTASPTTNSAPATITAAPTPSCVLNEEDPDQGINQAYCVCDGSATLSPLSVPPTGEQSDSCAYTTVPSTNSETVTTQGSTFTSDCQVCTQIQLNAPTCTPQSGCTPTAAIASVTAGSLPVHVGTLTGTALYTSISSALGILCPPVTQTTSSTVCATTGVAIKKISYVEDDSLLTDGELIVKVEASSYNVTSLRDAMINSAALTAQRASTSKSNCYNQSYIVEELKRRHSLPLLSFGPRASLSERDHPYPEVESIQFCNSVSFAGVNYYSQYWRVAPGPGSTDYIFTNWEFVVGPGGEFLCDFLQDLADDFVAVAPEFAVGEVELGEAIHAICADAEDFI